jgi:hypothetical protein
MQSTPTEQNKCHMSTLSCVVGSMQVKEKHLNLNLNGDFSIVNFKVNTILI